MRDPRAAPGFGPEDIGSGFGGDVGVAEPRYHPGQTCTVAPSP